MNLEELMKYNCEKPIYKTWIISSNKFEKTGLLLGTKENTQWFPNNRMDYIYIIYTK